MKKHNYITCIWISSLFLSLTTAVDFNLKCPDGWTKSYEQCYIAIPTLRSWSEADQYCQKYGARLAKPSGYVLNNYVATLFTNNNAEYWIGYNVPSSTSQRHIGFWSDGTQTTVEVGVWGDFEPNTPIGSCARVDKSHDNKWYMESCDRLLPSVCELTPCPDDTFRCTMTGRCLSFTNICDGTDDCGDESDERDCATDCKYYIRGTDGTVTMPTSGLTYPATSTCIWRIEAPVGHRIQIQITNFETEKDIDVVELWEGSPSLSDSHCLSRLSGQTLEDYHVLLSSNNFLTVRFVSDGSIQRKGFSFTWKTDFQCQIIQLTNKRYTTGQLGDVQLLTTGQDYSTCEQLCSNQITCTGFSYNKANNSCFLLKEVALPVDDNCCDLYVKTCPYTINYPVQTSIPYLGGTVTGTTFDQYIFSPLYPVSYPGNLETTWIIQSSGTHIITLEVKDIELCGSDQVIIKDGDNPITPTLMTLTSSTKAGEVVMSTGNRMFVYMKLKENLKCRGVLLSYKAACNFNLKRNTGRIFTPGYGVVNYPGALECFWSISSINGRPLRLTFDDYAVESNKDFVQAWVGVDDKGTPIHSGNGYSGGKPPPLISNTGKLAVKFLTSAVGNMKGFTATYTTGCLVLSSPSYVISPGRTSVIAGDATSVRCNTGYTFEPPYAGESTVDLTCQADGEYDKTIPVCSQAFCALVPSIVNGYVVSSTGLYGGDQVVYACNSGYTTPQGVDLAITCQSNSVWETPPTCIANMCPDLPLDVTSGRREIVYGNGTSHDTILSYSCDQNYQLIGQSRIICVSGTWSDSAPTCQKIRCSPQYITNGTAISTGTLYQGDDVTVACNTGFQLTGTSPYKCGIQAPPTCENINECTSGNATCNQNCVDIIGGYYCTCNNGYRISTVNPTICEDIDECAFTNGNCDHSCVDIEGSYRCNCNYGYELFAYNGFQGLTLQSGEDGSKPWHTYHVNHSCVLKQCPTPNQIISHGRSLSLQLTFTQGDSVQYMCDVGYVISGSNSATTTVTCQGDGTWSPAIPTCTIAQCFLDVAADSKTTPTGNINYGSSYQLICDSTNSTGVTLRRYCAYKTDTRHYGTVGDALQCPPRSCGTPTPISGSNPFSYTCNNYGCSFLFSCAGLYQRVGSSSNGDTTVRCGVDGRWDFGDLRCISALCTDPGTPPDATQIATSYEIGALVSYRCTRQGYGPQPTYPIQCINVGNVPRWNVTYNGNDPIIPTCVDRTAPTFLNCFTQDFTVELYKAPNHAIPTANDQSGFVRSVVTTPANYRPTHVVPSAMTVTYMASDSNGNTGACSFDVKIKDQVPPSIVCKSSQSYTITDETSRINVDPLDFVQSVENGASVTANTPSFVLTSSDVDRVRMITLTAIDPASNTASCVVQVYTTVSNRCQPWTISGANTQKTCVARPGNTGYDCTFICTSGYYFFNEVNSNNVVLSCTTNNDWNRKPPSCTARNAAYHRQAFVMKYGTGVLADANGCTQIYNTQLLNQWQNMATNLQTMCRVSGSAYPLLTISQPVDSSVPRLGVEYSNGIVYATFTFDMTPATYPDIAYTNCAQLIVNAFTNKQTELNPILSLAAQGSCPAVSTPSVTYDRTLKDYFVCATNAGIQRVISEAKSYCFDCALGYYSSDKRLCFACGAGFYLSTQNRDSCDACPSGTNSQKTGLTRQEDCYLSCPNGMISITGEAPCNQCGLDSHSSNRLSCTSCNGLKTTGVGKSSASDCKSSCSAGYYSYNGLETCTACPKNFYQAQTGQRQCLECASTQVTLSEAKTSPADCVDGYAYICTNRCLNGGSCSVVNHDYFCSCPTGYTGLTCENMINPCAIQPCYNSGQCTANGTTYTCTCTSNRFSGDRCENDIDDCAFANNFNPCNNGSCHDLVGGYTCLCPSFSGFTGSTCTTPRNPCVDDPCIDGQCTSYGSIRRKCVCTPGYTGDACEVNIDECASSPCLNGGTCIDGVNMFTCSCPVGFSGTFCHVRGTSNVCSGSCGTSQTCVDYYPEEKPYCLCPNGYNDNGNNCELNSYCQANSCLNSGTCISSYGGYICKCPPGYSGPSCQFTINNCVSSPCKNNGVCQNSVNSFTCTCTTPGTGGPYCDDNTNNCDPYPCNIQNTIQCDDRVNSFYCRCKPGFRGQTCNEGSVDCSSFPCLHGGTCATTSTGYQCTCAQGWFGNNCETMVDNCDPTSPCKNRATCYNSVSNYRCVCQPGYRGDACDIAYDLCDITKPCINNSTCVLSNGQPDCQCSSGYQGDTCNQRITACSTNSCQNGATCSEAGGSVTCLCLPGYTGSQCGTNIDECASNPCPTQATCIDGVNTYMCQCNDGKIGSNCDKDLTYKFDIIVQPGLMCGSAEGISMNSVFGLSTTKLSVSLWVRFKTVNPKVILSLYAMSSLAATPEMILQISSNAVSGSINGDTYSLTYGTGNNAVSIQDGVWHHVVVTWNALNTDNNGTGRVHVYVDNSLKGRTQNTVGTNHQLPAYGYLVLGGTYDATMQSVVTSNSITGKISRLMLAKEEFSYTTTISSLYSDINYKPTNNLINAPIAYIVQRGFLMIDYQDEMSAGICRTLVSCTGLNFASTLPTVSCPADQFVTSTDRVSSPTWTQATFTNTATNKVHYNVQSGSEQTWGVHPISSVGYDAENNAAVCVFRFFNKRGSCSNVNPPNPEGGSETCSSLPSNEGERCTIGCSQSNERPSQPGPYYYSCSRYGMFDMADRLEPFSYPPCAAAVSRTVNVQLKITYVNMTSACENYKSSLQQQLRSTFTTVSSQWQGKLCPGVDCNSIPVSVTCITSTQANVEVLFNTVEDPLQNTQSVIRSPDEVVAIAVVDDKAIKYTTAAPVQSSMEITLVPYCIEGQQIVGNYCVSCAPGSYYDSNTAKCSPCAIGQYQSSSGQTSCVNCPTGYTTYNTGTQSASLCLVGCSPGSYYSLSTSKCEFCPVGFYQPASGSFHCFGCGVGLSTPNLGTTQPTSCVDPTTITSTETPETNLGQSTTGGGLSAGEIAAIILSILILLLLIILILFCCCRDRLPCFGKGAVEPEDKTPFQHVNRYGETDLQFTSYKLYDIREKRGVRPLGRKTPRYDYSTDVHKTPRYDYSGEDTRSVHTDISVQVPVFLEKLDGSVSNRHTYLSNTAKSIISDQGTEVKRLRRKKKRKGKKKSKVPLTADYSDNVDSEHIYEEPPTSTPRTVPPSTTSLPKPLKPLPKRYKTPSEASFATNSKTDHSTSGVYSSNEYRKPKKEHTINIDSDNEDLR